MLPRLIRCLATVQSPFGTSALLHSVRSAYTVGLAGKLYRGFSTVNEEPTVVDANTESADDAEVLEEYVIGE